MGFERLKLKIPLYRQTLPTSCGSSSMLMVESFYDPKRFPPTPAREVEIHKGVSFGKGKLKDLEDIAGVAALMLKDGFHARYYVEGPRYRAPEIEENLWEDCLRSFHAYLDDISTHENGEVISGSCSIDNVINELSQERACICEIKYGRLVTHIVVVRGYKRNTVYVADPLRGYYTLPREELDDAMEQGFIKNFFSVWKWPGY